MQIFSNPHFQQQATSAEQSRDGKQRSSVKDIMDKYENRNTQGQGDRFTFQTGNQPQLQTAVSAERQTFGNVAPNTGYRITFQQQNPLFPQRQENTMLLESIDESMISNMSIYHQPILFNNAEKSQIIDKSQIGEDDIFEDMSMLRDKVFGLLQAYSNDLKEIKDPKQIKAKVQQDAKAIALEYSQIIQKVNQTDISMLSVSVDQSRVVQAKEQELTTMFQLVEEFLDKFDGLKNPNLNYSTIIEQKLAKSRKQSQKNTVKDNEEPQKINDITIINSNTLNQLDDTFYHHPQITEDKLKKKLEKLRNFLVNELEKTQLKYTKQILSDMIQNLNDIVTSNDVQTVKSIVFKIEQGIKELKLNDQGSINLYNYLVKAIKVTNKKINQLSGSYAMINNENKQLKRVFFDTAIKLKNKLPQDHPSKQEMVSLMFDEFIEQNIPENQMEAFITSKLFK